MSPSASAAPSLHADNVSEKKECAIDTPAVQTEQPKSDRGWRFWLIFLALCLALFLTALDLVCLPPRAPLLLLLAHRVWLCSLLQASISTALPSIIHDLDGNDSFAWVSSAYTLSCTAILPLSGRFADIFGRRSVMLVAIAIFAVGSAVTGAATSMGMLIAGRSKSRNYPVPRPNHC